jgi:phospholipid transport system substrate-binding protein
VSTNIRAVALPAFFAALVLLILPASAEDMDSTPSEPAGGPSEAAVAAAFASPPAVGARSPRQVVSDLNDSLLGVLKRANDLDYQGRFDLLAPILRSTFDLEYMARQAVGRSFLDLEEPQRQTWYALFKDYMTANYASRFDHYSKQRFEILGEEAGKNDTVLIRTQVIDPADENVDLSYRLRQSDGEWKVADVYLRGTVSELALRRSEYASVLKREGFDALTANIRAKIDELAAGGS